jgi:hypothetical protein
VQGRSLFDLPIDGEPLWTISEEDASVSSGAWRERCYAQLPAWEARSELDLTDESAGFPAACSTLADVLRAESASRQPPSPALPLVQRRWSMSRESVGWQNCDSATPSPWSPSRPTAIVEDQDLEIPRFKTSRTFGPTEQPLCPRMVP